VTIGRLPPGRAADEVLAQLDTFKSRDLDATDSRTFAYTYEAGAAVDAVMREAAGRFLKQNALDPTVYPSLLALENAVVGVAVRHLGGGPGAVGSFTSGGTESILLAVLAARNRWRAAGGQGRARIVVPITAHAAFHKAAAYFDLDLTVVDVDPVTFRAIPAALDAACGPDTALVVVSAPSYAMGVIDPVAEVAANSAARGIPCHVDGCVGAWMLPFLRRVGVDVPPFDLTVPGVTSVSMDFHKYGFAIKGASVVVYRDAELRRHQVFATSRWLGYTIINPTVQSTRGGAALAATWAVLNLLGDDGYLAAARAMADATRRLAEGLQRIAGLRLVAPPDMSLLAVASDGADLFRVADLMRVKRWYVQPQLSVGRHPATLHLSVHPGHVDRVEAFLADLAAAVAEASALPTLAPEARGALAQVAGAALASGDLEAVLGAVGVGGDGPPEETWLVNHALDALPPADREALLVRYFDLLYRPT
jgi:glutamate/tyrosine decarboxylase-like PLP-dependent enzyme